MKRRSLFIISFTLSVLMFAGFSSVNLALHAPRALEETGRADQHKMIGCLIGDFDPEKAPAGLTDARGYEITFSAGFDRGLAHQPCAAFVIDRHLIKEHAWDRYADFIHQFHNDTPLMIVDNIRDWIRSSNLNRKG